MSDAYIVRRGGGGEGFDPNGAVLKVITSTGCTVLVTGTGYSKTHQQADGFPRSGDANVTEHFFSIPASAFGTITVKATNTYGDNTKTLTVNTAGEVYELLCGGPNIILDSTFGLQSGMQLSSYFTYSDRDKSIHNKGTYPSSGNVYKVFTNDISVNAFDTLTVKARSTGNQSFADVILQDVSAVRLAYLAFSYETSTEKSATIQNKFYPTAQLMYGRNLAYIDEIVLT